MHADRTNRTGLLLFAVVLIAVGGLGAAASYGLFGTTTKHKPLISNQIAAFIGRNGEWFWPVAALLALIVVLLALRWLLALLFSTDRTGAIAIAGGGGNGRTVLASGALTGAVAAEIDSYRGVDSARARMIGDSDTPELVVVVRVEESANLPALVERIETKALAHAREAVGDPSLRTTMDVTVTSKRSNRVN